MKKIAFYIPLVIMALLIASCGGGNDEAEEEEIDFEKNPLGALMKMGENMEKQMKEIEEKAKEREEKGDVLAMEYDELQKYLPSSIDGYTAGEPDGATINMQGMSYSSATIGFTKDNGDFVKVSLLDYNAAFGLYNMATSMWALGISVNTPEEKASGIKFEDGITGWQSFKKKQNTATIVLGIGQRFMLTVEANNQEDTDFVKDIAKSLDMDDLAEL